MCRQDVCKDMILFYQTQTRIKLATELHGGSTSLLWIMQLVVVALCMNLQTYFDSVGLKRLSDSLSSAVSKGSK